MYPNKKYNKEPSDRSDWAYIYIYYHLYFSIFEQESFIGHCRDEILNFKDVDDSDMMPMEFTNFIMESLMYRYEHDLYYPLSAVRFGLNPDFYLRSIELFYKRVRALLIACEFRYDYDEKKKYGVLWSKKRNEEDLSGSLKDCNDHYVCMAFHLLDNEDTFISLDQVEEIEKLHMRRKIGNYEYCSR